MYQSLFHIDLLKNVLNLIMKLVIHFQYIVHHYRLRMIVSNDKVPVYKIL